LPRLNYSGFLSHKPKSQSAPHQHTYSQTGDAKKQDYGETEQIDANDQAPTDKERTVANIIQSHPWAAVGLGFILGGLVGRTIKRSYRALRLTQHQD
jgi:hypothetical protein